MKLFLKTIIMSIVMAVFSACGSSLEWFPTTNNAPFANAGPAQSVVVGAIVTLDGSASSDADGNPLTYSWSMTSKPAGSTATLSSGTAVKPTFTADLAGAYVLSLIVTDGKISSVPATVTVTASVGNAPPVANSGTARSVAVGAVVTLDGSASSDANGDPLTYSWSLTSQPTGSTATLSSTTAVNPTFTAAVAGSYVLSLTVNDGKTNSAASSVTITCSDAPIANAGPAQSVIVGDTVTLSGSASSDPNGDPLTYSWSLTGPVGSTATLSSTTAASPTFTADLVGAYNLSLTVNDGKVNSTTPATVTITAFTSPPVANAGIGLSVIANTTVQLDGSGSIGAIQQYNWQIVSRPPGAGSVALSSATVVNPTFTPTVTGTYVIQLQVFDRLIGSPFSTVTVTCNLGSLTVTW